jgi:hypothetical protein
MSESVAGGDFAVVTCGSCGTKLKLRLEVMTRHRKGKCPKCGIALHIAAADEHHKQPAAAPRRLADWKALPAPKLLTFAGVFAAVAAAAGGASLWWMAQRFDLPIGMWIVRRSILALVIGAAVATAMLAASGRRNVAARALCGMLAIGALVAATLLPGHHPVIFDLLFVTMAMLGSSICFIISQPPARTFTSAA